MQNLSNLVEINVLNTKNNLMKLNNDIEETENKIINLKNYYKIKSFSQIYENIIMWSLYSASHRGYCVKFDFSNLKIKNNLSNINYSNKRKFFLENDKNVIKIIKAHTKSQKWKFEKEMRLFLKIITNVMSLLTKIQ